MQICIRKIGGLCDLIVTLKRTRLILQLDRLSVTSQHQSAREETGENKKSLKHVMFDSQVSLKSKGHRVWKKKKKKKNIQEFRPGRSAMQ